MKLKGCLLILGTFFVSFEFQNSQFVRASNLKIFGDCVIHFKLFTKDAKYLDSTKELIHKNKHF